jgi:hypothetical protein
MSMTMLAQRTARSAAWLAVVAAATFAAETAAAGAEDVGKESPTSHSISESIWYDAESETVVPVAVIPEVDDSLHRQSRWLPKAKRVVAPKNNTGGGAGTAGGGNGLFGSGLTIGNLFGWVVLICIIGVSIGGFAYALSKAEMDVSKSSRSGGRRRSEVPDEQTIERMKHLPAELRRTDVNLRSEAQRLQGEGHYDQAIILLFGHQLLLLDQVGMLRLNRGKTNRKYVRETRAVDGEAARLLADTVTAFERSYFGRHLIARDEFDQLWSANLELERLADRRRETAA